VWIAQLEGDPKHTSTGWLSLVAPELFEFKNDEIVKCDNNALAPGST